MDVAAMQDLLKAIKTDDIDLFARIVENKKSYLSLSFGRLPLLSLCYLYKSKKINGAYRNALLKISNYTIVDEDYEAYKLFKRYAKTCLRLYVFEQRIVSPLEMLAIVGDTLYLKEVFKKAAKNQIVEKSIISILSTLYNQEAKITERGIIIAKRKKLSRIQKISIITISVIVCLAIAFSAVAWDAIYKITGRGTIENPVLIQSEAQLKLAMEKNLYYLITKDIYLSKNWTPSDFAGHIDGNGHTIFANSHLQEGLIITLEGSVQNINLTVKDLNIDIEKNIGFFAHYNNGLISNVNMAINAIINDDAQEESIFVGLLAHENNGKISDCVVDADISFFGDGIKDAHIAAIAAINNGSITNCSTQEGSLIDTVTVDIGGIVAINGEEGLVDGCINNAYLKQSSDSDYWYPQIGGVVWFNYGVVKNSINNGKIYLYSGADETILEMYAGGVVCINDNEIIKSKNTADIELEAEIYHIYAGGIAAFNNIATSSVVNSASYGGITANSNGDDAFVFVGGVVGYSLGLVEDCFAYNDFLSEDKESVFIGGIAGLVLSNSAYSINNYYVINARVEFGAAAILYYFLNQPRLDNGSDIGVTMVNSYEELQAIEVYWQ